MQRGLDPETKGLVARLARCQAGVLAALQALTSCVGSNLGAVFPACEPAAAGATPGTSDPRRVLADVQAGAVSVAAALRDCGVAVDLEAGTAVRA